MSSVVYCYIRLPPHSSNKMYALVAGINEFYVHGTVHLSNTSHINTNKMQLFLFSLFGVRTLHVSDALCVHHQEHYKL